MDGEEGEDEVYVHLLSGGEKTFRSQRCNEKEKETEDRRLPSDLLFHLYVPSNHLKEMKKKKKRTKKSL